MRVKVLSSVLALCAASGTVVGVARAETNDTPASSQAPEIGIGTALVATADVNLQRAALAKGARVHVTKVAMQKGRLTTVDVELADGHVLKRVAIDAILKSFVVATDE